MTPAQHIAKTLGQTPLAEALGVGVTAVNNAVKRKHFPATWYPVIRDMCAAHGIECSEEAFNFKSPSVSSGSEASCHPHDVDTNAADCKGNAA